MAKKWLFPYGTFWLKFALLHFFKVGGVKYRLFRKNGQKNPFFIGKNFFFRERIKCWAQVGRFRQPVRTEVIEVKFSKKIMIFDIFLWFLTFSPIWLTFDSLLSWSELSGVKKYVYNIKGHLSQKRLKKEIFAKICWKKLKFCWFLIPFIFLTKSDRHIL